jgi:arginine-tRNA-protein transferase
MAEHKNNLSREAERIREELQQYFVHSSIECPYGLPFQAVYNQALFDTLPDFVMDAYLASGYRRNGNIIYNMHCSECKACIPLRIDPKEFIPSRSQKRVLRKNQDLTVEIKPLTCSEENLELLGKFLDSRYPAREGLPLDYYTGFFLNNITNTVEFSYRIDSKLIGVSIVDLNTDWLNVVFFYFDPAEKKRSPGTYNILYLIEFCLQQKIKFIYLGYWIEGVDAMSYKANFKPHYVFRDSTWKSISA